MGDDDRVGGELRRYLLGKRQTFRNVVVVPQSVDRHHGGPIWPSFHLRIRARTCWGVLPVPIDTRPRCAIEPPEVVPAAFWGGLVGWHYGHMIADFGMRIVPSGALDPELPLLFSVPERPDYRPPAYFWQMIDALKVDRGRVLLVREPVRVDMLHVLPQAERPFGGGPARRHLDLMDRWTGDKRLVSKDIACLYVSRAKVGRGGLIAGESYLQQALAACGVRIYHPEDHSVAKQIAMFCRARRLVFSEGSALHSLQLVGRIGADVAVLVRRPYSRFLAASLAPRVSRLDYLDAVAGLIRGLGDSARTQRNRGITVLDEAKLLRRFCAIGIDLAPHWDTAAYRADRDRDLAAWRTLRQSTNPDPSEDAFIDKQFRRLARRYPDMA